MDGVHDIGGVQGFGPVKTNEPDVPFKTDWDARMWGLNGAMSQPDDWTLDWWRHVRELIDPVDYLTRPYFDQWAQIYMALLIDSGVASLEEIVSGHAQGPNPELGPVLKAQDVPAAMGRAGKFDSDDTIEPAFADGSKVRTKAAGHSGHTRLPRYAMGRGGVVHAHHGTFVFADAKARGEDVYEPLYSVAFMAADLWPEAQGRKDRIYLDLWESYLDADD